MGTKFTFEISDELAERLQPNEDRLPTIIELGLRELATSPEESFQGTADIFEFLANLPSPEEILALEPQDWLGSRIEELTRKRHDGELTAEEHREWEHYHFVEHLVRVAKLKAFQKQRMTRADS